MSLKWGCLVHALGVIWGSFCCLTRGVRCGTNLSPIDVRGPWTQLSNINYTLFAAVRDDICSLFDDSYSFIVLHFFCLFRILCRYGHVGLMILVIYRYKCF